MSDIIKRTLYVLVGLPGSGKSTYARYLSERHRNVRWISSDNIRREWVSTDCKFTNEDVFNEMLKRTIAAFDHDCDVIYDATNLERKYREALLNKFGDRVIKKAVWFKVPYDVCVERNSRRERTSRVPIKVMERYNELFSYENYPSEDEGFDEILVMINR